MSNPASGIDLGQREQEARLAQHAVAAIEAEHVARFRHERAELVVAAAVALQLVDDRLARSPAEGNKLQPPAGDLQIRRVVNERTPRQQVFQQAATESAASSVFEHRDHGHRVADLHALAAHLARGGEMAGPGVGQHAAGERSRRSGRTWRRPSRPRSSTIATHKDDSCDDEPTHGAYPRSAAARAVAGASIIGTWRLVQNIGDDAPATLTFCSRLSGRRIMRWPSTGGTICFTSSGSTIRSAADRRDGLRRAIQRDRRPRAAAHAHVVVLPRGVDDLRDVVADLRVDVHRPHRPLAGHELIGRDHRLQLVQRMLALEHLEHLRFFVERRIAERELHQEAVELRFRQRERAFVVDRVLRGDEQKRRLQAVAFRRRSSPSFRPSLPAARLASAASRG